MRNLFIGLTMATAIMPTFAHTQTVRPDVVTPIEMSNRDINRVTCVDGAINDAFFSQEKGIVVENSGNNSFVKFLINDNGQSMDYVTARSEFYIVCAGDIYTLMVTPKDISGQTIRLSTGAKVRIEENQKLLSPLPDEERAIFLTLAALRDDIPESFTVTDEPQDRWRADKTPSKPGTNLSLRRSIRVEGMGLTLKEFLVKTQPGTTFEETDFLATQIDDSIFAVTMDPLRLEPGQIGRLFVISKEGF